MFVIVYNNSVILGPMRWNRFRFENEIEEECELSVTLQDKNENFDPITVSDEIQILPIQGTQNPEFNPKIEYLHGPFWEFTDTNAIMSYRVEQLPLDAVKNFLKAETANERWNKENAGTKVTIGGTEYTFKTDKETRSLLSNQVGNPNGINWKISSDTWVTMTQEDVVHVLGEVLSYVQSCFDWEYSKVQEIDACLTGEQLDSVVIAEPKENAIGVM